ncbi:MAG TPA: hypothetical protein VFS07_01220 [Gemmatimonadales bacterium]|nr:hypothetical protein [Gemmatimonadales bacterium]
MSFVLRAAVPLTLIALAGCADPAGTAPTDEAAAPGGPMAGATVTRTEEPFTWFLVDEASGMQVHFGRDVQSLCAGTGAQNDLLDIQVITNPVEALRQIRQVHGDVKTSVWPIGPNSCAYYNSTTPLATGMSNFRGTDNDVAPFDRPDPKNTNAYGFMANGKLTGPDGARLIFQATFRGTWDGVDPATERSHTDIRLH